MYRNLLSAALILVVVTIPAYAETSDEEAKAAEAEKQAQCQLQGDLMGAVQQARLDRVRKSKVNETLIEANPDWPEGVTQAIPALVSYVYGLKRSELKEVDLGESTKTQCLDNWEEIQKLKNSVTN